MTLKGKRQAIAHRHLTAYMEKITNERREARLSSFKAYITEPGLKNKQGIKIKGAKVDQDAGN
jgi:hypothetical protein